MMDRRSLLVAGIGLGTMALAPAASVLRGASPVQLDMIDLDVWTGKGAPPAAAILGKGLFLLPEHWAMTNSTRQLTALLSPANALLFAEYLRFDHRVVEEYPVGPQGGLALPHARIMIARRRQYAKEV